jgi:hypothetical protein
MIIGIILAYAGKKPESFIGISLATQVVLLGYTVYLGCSGRLPGTAKAGRNSN